MIYFLFVWLILLFAAFIWFFVTNSHLLKIRKYIVKSFDNFFYDYSLWIHFNKDKFYDFDKAIEVIFYNQKKFIWLCSYELYHSRDYAHTFKNDINYVETKLLYDDKVFNHSVIANLEDIIYNSFWIIRINKFFYYMMSIMSIWIINLIKTPKKNF